MQWDSVPYTDFDENKASYLLSDGDILFARTGATVGKSYLVQGLTEKAIYASYLIRVQTYDMVLPQYVKFYFESGYYWEQIEQESVGVGQPNVNGTILGNLHIPIPPIHEQDRIVSELSKWMGIIDVIEQGKTDLQSVIKQAKSKILDLAIHGKLVPQNPSDEPASELLKRINPKAEITCDNGQYGQLPKGWCLCRIKDIAESSLGKTLDKNKDRGELKDYLCSINILWDKFDLTLIKQCRIEEMDFQRYAVKKGDLLVCEGGDVGRAAIWYFDKDMYYQNALHRIRFKDKIHSRFFLYSFMYLKQCGLLDDISKGVTIKHLTQTTMNNIYFPLPPLEEQKRIVDAIDKAFAKLDTIMESL